MNTSDRIGEKGTHVLRIFILFGVCLLSIVAVVFGFIKLIDLYFTWLKGD